MDMGRPYTVVCPTLDSEVLAVLAGTRRPMTGREVARLAGRSPRGVLEVLSRLAEHGLVDREEAGRALLFTLNREHLAAPAVDALAGLRAELLRRIREAVASWEVHPVNVSLFGSTARGEGDTHSDIDLFVVRPDEVTDEDAQWRSQVDDLARKIQRWTGNHASVAEAAQGELTHPRWNERPIADELRSDAIVLGGIDLLHLPED
jgi:predicted nucleotidyltransferase